MNNIPRHYLLIGGILLFVVLIGTGYVLSQRNAQANADKKESVFEEPEDVIPTVDSSVKVSIKGRTEAVITVEGIPEGTEEIEYQLTYNKKNLIEGEGLQDGVLGRIQVKQGVKKVQEDVTFGTCSSGVCRYHDIDGPVHAVFLFTGSYGEKILEKDLSV